MAVPGRRIRKARKKHVDTKDLIGWWDKADSRAIEGTLGQGNVAKDGIKAIV
jgi:hypothetical protein